MHNLLKSYTVIMVDRAVLKLGTANAHRILPLSILLLTLQLQ